MPTNPDNTPSEKLLETATVLSEWISEGNLDPVQATLEYLYHTPEGVSPDTLREHAPCPLGNRAAESIVYQLQNEDILTSNEIDTNSLQTVFEWAELLHNRTEEPENTIVATIPYEDPALDQTMFEPLLSSTIELIQSAEDHLVLMSPFLNEEAYEKLRPALHTAAGNGASITLIARYLTYGDDDSNREFTSRVLDDSVLTNQTTCYEYIDNESWTTFHAKIVISDGEQAYLGTANLTHIGLGENLEVGVLFRDGTASRLAGLVDALEKSKFLHEVTRNRQRFTRV